MPSVSPLRIGLTSDIRGLLRPPAQAAMRDRVTMT